MSTAAYLNAERWTEAACIGWDPAIFHPEKVNVDTASLALAICADCKLKDQCLTEYVDDDYGVFGATTPRQRQAIRGSAS